MWKVILVIGALLVVGAYGVSWCVNDTSSGVARNAAGLLLVGVVVLAVGLVVAAVHYLRRLFGKKP